MPWDWQQTRGHRVEMNILSCSNSVNAVRIEGLLGLPFVVLRLRIETPQMRPGHCLVTFVSNLVVTIPDIRIDLDVLVKKRKKGTDLFMPNHKNRFAPLRCSYLSLGST
jgi:ribosomal protein S27AE